MQIDGGFIHNRQNKPCFLCRYTKHLILKKNFKIPIDIQENVCYNRVKIRERTKEKSFPKDLKGRVDL